MSGIFCFGCNYPGEEHDEACDHFVDVDRLRAQVSSWKSRAEWEQSRADTMNADAGRRHVENLKLTAEVDQLRAEVEQLRTFLREEVADNVTCGNCCECANDMRADAQDALDRAASTGSKP